MFQIIIEINNILDVFQFRLHTGLEMATSMEAVNAKTPVMIDDFSGFEDATAFRALNEEWIVRFFALEEADRKSLNDPEGKILAKGGRIFMARQGDLAVGCVALVPMGNGVYELSKMAVSPELRGQGIGRALLLHAIEGARLLGATSLFLGSNSKLVNAVHLYESVGFSHVPPERLPEMPYTRANVFMEMQLS